MPTKPRVFIASSREAKELAEAVQQNLEAHATVTVWDQDAIHLGETVLDGLIRNCAESQFGVFVIAPDDNVIMREHELAIVRDNVILELGMFVGRIGKERSFIIRPDRTVEMHLPSDLAGINVGQYDASRKDNLRAAVAPVCRQIANAMSRQATSQLSNQTRFLDELVKFSLETVCRAMGAPRSPEQASLRLFIFRKEGEELVCRHYWDPNPSDEQVGITRFSIDSETAKQAIIVRCYLEKRTKRTDDGDSHGSEVSTESIADVKIKAGLKYVLAAPIRNEDGSIWGVVDFDASNQIGRELLQTDFAATVMISLVRLLQFIVGRA